MKKTLFATAAMAALLGPVAFSAQRSASNPTSRSAALDGKSATAVVSTSVPTMPVGAKIHELSGRIVSMNDTTLTVSPGQGEHVKDYTFMLNAATKREGTLISGEMVNVEYWMHGKDSIATLVQVRGLTTATKPSTKPNTNY